MILKTMRRNLRKHSARLKASGIASVGRAAKILAQELPKDWRVVVVDRNTHFNHLYVLPRVAVLPQHAYKAFIPYTSIFQGLTEPKPEDPQKSPRVVLLQAQVTGLSPHSVTLSKAFPKYGIETPVLNFDYAIYSLGSHLPAPINIWGPSTDGKDLADSSGSKREGITWLAKFHSVIEKAPSVLVVGGGALGIQYATDIAEAYPNKPVTLLHSREKLLPRFDDAMHKESERLDLSSVDQSQPELGQVKTVKTLSGREISAGLVLLCTGQTPNTAIMKSLLPNSIVSDGSSKGKIRVKRSLQVAVPDPEHSGNQTNEDDVNLSVPYPNLFAIGDAADAFGAMNAGHTARFQAEVAVHNILQLIRASESSVRTKPQLERYEATPPGIKISLGLRKGLYQMNGEMAKTEVPEDLEATFMWRAFGVDTDNATLHK
ncbi:hypothetical protein EIP86_010367 [Pleurotus ostreatoroseus]|nr:hypothetical protein EIP86_010367 [Pleurotus ostreatoroseus]